MQSNNRVYVPPYELKEVKPYSFVFEIHPALPPELCREMIRRFEEKSDQQYAGRIGQLAQEDQQIKRSTDLVVSGKQDWQDIDTNLHRSVSMAMKSVGEKFPYFRGPFKDIGYQLQRTLPGEYYHWHIDGGSHQFAERQLVIVWYLNDVQGPGGETEFLYQDLKIRPQEGKMVLFPPFWTHEHRGVELQEGVKYIATTWVVFA